MFKGIFKTIILLSLALCFGMVAQAQTIARVSLLSNSETGARAGGKAEDAGDVFLDIKGNPSSINSATLTYSAPISSSNPVAVIGTGATLVTAEMGDHEKGILRLDAFTGSDDTVISITGVTLDVSEASADPVTVTLLLESSSAGGEDDLALLVGLSSVNVINEVKLGMTAEADMGTIRTRGTDAKGIMATLTLEESFKDAFMEGNLLDIKFSGIPEGASLTAVLTGIKIADDEVVPAVETANTDPYATILVTDDSATVTLGGDDGTTGTDMRVAPDKVVLEVTLTAMMGDDDIAFPLVQSPVMAKATFTDPTGGTDNFEDSFTPYVTIFEIRPAQCQLLFPTVAVVPDSGWNTAFGIVNPGYSEGGASGGLNFTFYGNDGTVAEYSTTMDMVVGAGLDSDGTLPPGGTPHRSRE